MSAILYGTKRIAAHLNAAAANENEKLSIRQVGYMIERGLLPTFKMGVIHCATPDALAEHFDQLRRNSGDSR
jgi:hypothetical protein